MHKGLFRVQSLPVCSGILPHTKLARTELPVPQHLRTANRNTAMASMGRSKPALDGINAQTLATTKSKKWKWLGRMNKGHTIK